MKYRKDGYAWKKRKDGKTTREDHMKLKIQGMQVSSTAFYFENGISGFNLTGLVVTLLIFAALLDRV